MTIFLNNIQGTDILLNKEKSHYLSHVLRCEIGDRIEVIDGKGKRYLAVIKSKRNLVCIRIIDVIEIINHHYPTILCQAIIKGVNMESVIRQTTELGVKEIYPIITERTIVRETAKLNRWRKIAEESTEQSGRTHLAIIHEPINLIELLNTIDMQRDLAFVFQKNGVRLNPSLLKKTPLEKVFLFVGPEGDFTDDEIRIMSEMGIKAISLGRFVLRADTAGIIAVAIIHHYIDDYD